MSDTESAPPPTEPARHAQLAPATHAVTAGRPPRTPGADPNEPVHFSSTFVAHGEIGYGRFGNPSWTALEEAVGTLEGGEALVFASGMAAVTAALSLLDPAGRSGGPTVLAPDQVYNGTEDVLGLLAEREVGRGVRVLRRPAADTDGMLADLARTDLLWLESPTNPLMEVVDLPAVLAAAREERVLSVVDNTMSTPLLCRPLSLGGDIVVHSATKYLSGHSDVVLGVVVTAATERGRALRERLHRHRTLAGAIAGPMECYLALRGLRTLAVRFERACANARELARRLEGHVAVSRVRYPGTGAMLSIELHGDRRAAEAVCSSTSLWLESTSLGGVESQLERRRRHASEPASVPEDLVRLSVGIEDVEDLWADLSQALDHPTSRP